MLSARFNAKFETSDAKFAVLETKIDAIHSKLDLMRDLSKRICIASRESSTRG